METQKAQDYKNKILKNRNLPNHIISMSLTDL